MIHITREQQWNYKRSFELKTILKETNREINKQISYLERFKAAWDTTMDRTVQAFKLSTTLLAPDPNLLEALDKEQWSIESKIRDTKIEIEKHTLKKLKVQISINRHDRIYKELKQEIRQRTKDISSDYKRGQKLTSSLST